ncbi:hypothetical protein [Desulfosediminicola flagellatus]|uniref:hypothetical protein n=1 Tax=Desulfosediminicola flagellatus TaxID=2569541 RepID=UPI0010AB69E9|nr:hypothetical protein [Desulfosediminicola flagellatus]
MAEEQQCLECGKLFTENLVETEHGAFCRPCYDALLTTVKEQVAVQNSEINYPLSLAGGLLGAALGVLIWWAITFYSGYSVGIVAIVIGITVAKGITVFNGNRRSQSIQLMAVAITVIAFFYADYLVVRSYILSGNEAEYINILTYLPDPKIFLNVLKETFEAFNLVFLGIAIWQAWTMTRPYKFE